MEKKHQIEALLQSILGSVKIIQRENEKTPVIPEFLANELIDELKRIDSDLGDAVEFVRN